MLKKLNFGAILKVIGAVGFMNQRLDIPKDVDPQWASIIGNCWHRFVSIYSCLFYPLSVEVMALLAM